MDIFVQFRTTIKIIKLNAQCLEDTVDENPI